jgi:peptidoglycan/xylan/chitin deacetylase (PgdA/CDA1 family)
MGIILRLDLDKPYGNSGMIQRIASKMIESTGSGNFRLPGYLKAAKQVLTILNKRNVPAVLFVREVTLPDSELLELINDGGHEIGHHLENSRTLETYRAEQSRVAKACGRALCCFSKHGSGQLKLGKNHDVPYEPEKYLGWGAQTGMKLFLGNGTDPEKSCLQMSQGLYWFSDAYWLHTAYRNTRKHSIDYLEEASRQREIVVLFHPENYISSGQVRRELDLLLDRIPAEQFINVGQWLSTFS